MELNWNPDQSFSTFQDLSISPPLTTCTYFGVTLLGPLQHYLTLFNFSFRSRPIVVGPVESILAANTVVFGFWRVCNGHSNACKDILRGTKTSR